jgi:hypothetical protein
MPVTFSEIRVGESYSRQTLASLWGYSSFHAIARGVVTPTEDDKIVLFVTEEKQDSAEQYADRLKDGILEWEGPTDHFAEARMIAAADTGEEIHLFHRDRHHSDFFYLGMLQVMAHTARVGSPSEFKFKVIY